MTTVKPARSAIRINQRTGAAILEELRNENIKFI